MIRRLGASLALLATLAACKSNPTPEEATNVVPDAGVDAAPDAEAPECTKGADCPSGICNQTKRACEAPTCTDGVKNGTESDLDCGGGCPPCAVAKRCATGSDCTTAVCKDSVCQEATSSDGVKNGAETDIDCGGPGNPVCAIGKGCATRDDCETRVCKTATCAAPTPADGVQNGTETDIDCGGPDATPCADGKACTVADDCSSSVCTGQVCQVPTPTDGVKNGLETDVDCGGTGNPTCAAGKKCLANADCTSTGCNYAKRCAVGRSCTRHFGGDTCGLGGAGGLGAAAWEDCCVTAPITPTTGPTNGKTIQLGVYPVTAGRMRAFLEAVSYDVRGFVKTARAAGKIPPIPGNAQNRTLLEADWDMYLPTSFAGNTNGNELADCTQGQTTEAVSTTCNPGTQQPGLYTSIKNHLGGVIFKNNAQTASGCFVGAPGTHAFRFPAGQQDGSDPDYDESEYDSKAMQCIDYLVGQAFCIWDGGRLEFLEEWVAATGPGAFPWSAQINRTPRTPGTDTYWGCRFPWTTDANQNDCPNKFDANVQSIELAAYNYSYEYPKLLGEDYLPFIAIPGRNRGRGPQGHSDLVGNNFELTSSITYDPSPHAARHYWTGNGSWEGHGYGKGAGSFTQLLNKYGKLGLRCAYP